MLKELKKTYREWLERLLNEFEKNQATNTLDEAVRVSTIYLAIIAMEKDSD